MSRQRAKEGPPQQVTPENALLVPRLLFQKLTPRPAIRRGDMMENARMRLEHGLVAGALQAKSQVHILEIRAEGFGKAADFQKSLATIEGAGSAGTEHRPRSEKCRAERLPVSPLAHDAADRKSTRLNSS